MPKDPKDRILDAALKEVLRGQGPPDLKDRIMHQLEVDDAATDLISTPSRADSPLPSSNSLNSSGAKSTRSSTKLSDRRTDSGKRALRPANTDRETDPPPSSTWKQSPVVKFAIALSLVVALISALVWINRDRPTDGLVERDSPGQFEPTERRLTDDTGALENRDRAQANQSIDPSGRRQIVDGSSSPFAPDQNASPFDAINDAETIRQPDGPSTNSSVPRIRLSDQEIVSRVNRVLETSHEIAGVAAAPVVDDETWLGRVFDKLIGREPNRNETASFLQNSDPEKRFKMVERIVSDPRYQREFAEHWSDNLASFLLDSGARRNSSLYERDELVAYLSRSVEQNVPYDELAHELINATSSSPGDNVRESGADQWMLSMFSRDSVLATSETSRIFLGQRIQCVQCHDGYENDQRNQLAFWQLNAYLRQMGMTRDNDNHPLLVDRNFMGQDGDPKNAALFFEDRRRVMRAAYPAFEGELSESRSGLIAEFDRRRELAKRITESDQFRFAAINRLWAYFFGYGFTRPVDDMGDHNPVSHPEIMDHLANQWHAHGHDLRKLMTWIVTTDAFAYSSDIGSKPWFDLPQLGMTPLFSRHYEDADDVLKVDSGLALMLRAYKDPGASVAARRSLLARALPTPKNGVPAVDLKIIDTTSLTEVDPRLDKLPWGSDPRLSKRLEEIAASSMSPQEKIQHLFWLGLADQPTRRQLDICQKMLDEKSSNPLAAYQDIWWIILNSREFVTNR